MSKINELIQTLCPDGVEYKKLGELFSFKNGISKNKSFFGHGQPIINFTDVYHHVRLYSTMIKGLVDATDSELERFGVCKGDCFFTRTSETKEDIGRASVIVDDIENCVFSGFLIKGHPITDLLMPEYCSYCFNSGDFRKTIVENANMTTRATITGEILSKIEIPVPPLPVQEEIVRILDEYTDLEAELEAKLSEEIELKQKQYEVYRCEVLTFGDDVERKSLNDLCDYVDYRGKTPKKTTSGRFLVTAKNIGYGMIDYEKSKEYIAEDDYDMVMRRGVPQIGDVLITTEAPMGHVAQVDDDTVALAQRVIKYCSKNKNVLINDFLKHYCLGQEFQQLLFKSANNGGTVAGIKGSILHTLEIPVPSLTEQERIVKILDKYDTYTRDMISTLNTELESRKKQYAYYRDQLLTFKRKE